MKKFISVMLAAVMLLGIVPFSRTAGSILGATEANAKETVKGSFDCLVDYIYRNGELDEDGETVSVLAESSVDSNIGAVATLAYSIEDNTVLLGFVIAADTDSLSVIATPAVAITEIDNQYLAYAVIYTDYSYLAAYADLDPAKYYPGQKLDFELVSDNLWFWGSASDVSAELSTMITNIVTGFDEYLKEELGFGLGNFGFTNISAPSALPGASVSAVELNDVEMNYKNYYKLSPKITGDSYVTYTAEYKSSDPSVATVDKNGNVYAAGRGTAEITCTVTDQSGNVVEDTCTVTVKFTFWQWIIWILLLGFLWY